MPRNPALRGLRWAGTVLVVAAFAGCGTAMAADGTPVWSSAPPPRVSSSPVPAHSPTHSPAHSPAPSPTHSPAHSPAKNPSPKSSPSKTPPARPRAGSGPAQSLMKTGSSAVALTFDDGPDPVQTPKLLDLLAARHVKATFCLVGQNVAAHPDLVRRIAAEGHTLCNHSWRHSLTLGKEKPAAIRADLQRTNDAIRAAAPGAEIKYLRAPGGNFTPNFVKVAAELGMRSIYWQVDPRDWDHPAGESDAAHQVKVRTAIKQHISKGAIVLSHDYQQPDTIAVYRSLLPWLQQRYRLIALP